LVGVEAVDGADDADVVDDEVEVEVFDELRATTMSAITIIAATTPTTTRLLDFDAGLALFAGVAATELDAFGAVVETGADVVPRVGTGGMTIVEAAAFLAVDFLAELFLTADFLTAFFAVFLTAVFLTAVFLTAVFLTALFFTADFLAVFFTADFFAAVFLAEVFLAADFFAVVFFTATELLLVMSGWCVGMLCLGQEGWVENWPKNSAVGAIATRLSVERQRAAHLPDG